ncbi:MAG: hypothetical protein WC163_08710 [Sulfurovum sp.]|nr:hypothetical protein [Sulfurovum sp.]
MKRIEIHKKQDIIFYGSRFLFSSETLNHQSQSNIFRSPYMFTKVQAHSSSGNVTNSVISGFSAFPGEG